MTCTEPEKYGSTLLRLATLSPAIAQLGLAIGMFDSRGKLENRIEQLLNPRRILMTHVRFVTGATVLGFFGIFLGWIAATRVRAEIPAASPNDDAATVAKEAQADTAKPAEARDAKQLRLFLTYQGESDKPFYDLILSVPPVSQRVKPFRLFHQISAEQGEKILSQLKESRFFEHATTTQAEVALEVKPHYLLRVQFGETGFDQSLGWDSATITRLKSLHKSFEGDAAKSMDQLLARLDGVRKDWESGKVVAAASDDDYQVLHDRYQKLILAAVKLDKKRDVEELTEKFNESIGGKLLFVQVTPRVGPIAQHEVMFSKFFDPSRKIVIGKIAYAVSDKPIVSQNHDGQNITLIATNPLGENKWPNDLQVTLAIDQTSSSETSAYEDAINRVIKKLPAGGMWVNGLTPDIGLAADAKPDDVIAEAIKKHAPAGVGKPYRVLHVKTVKFTPPVGSVSAALIQNDAGTRVLMFYAYQDGKGWWTRFYESDFVTPKAANSSSVQKHAVYQKAIDQLISKLAADGLWNNGRFPRIELASDAKPFEVIADAMRKRDSSVAVQPYRVLHLQEITSEPQFKGASAALIQNKAGVSVLLFSWAGQVPGWNWWNRFFEIELPPESLESSAYGDEMFEQAVDRLNANRRNWELNGRRDTVNLPADAAANDVLEAALKIANAPFNEIKSFHVVSVRKLEKLVAPGTSPWFGALLDTNLGQKIVIGGYLNDEAGWWPVLVDVVPVFVPSKLNP
jgi:hypothetical protein